MRHYTVSHSWKSKYLPADFKLALEEYDRADVIDQHVQLPMRYDKVLISDLKRTYETMKFVLKDCNYEATPLLNEVPIAPFTNWKRQFNVNLLNLKARAQWLFDNAKQPETKSMTIKRANDFIGRYLRKNRNYLIVGHGFCLKVLSRQMLKQGFQGKAFTYLKNGQHYTYRLLKGATGYI